MSNNLTPHTLISFTVRLLGILASELSSHLVMLSAICLVQFGNLGHQRIIGVGVCEQGADGQQNLREVGRKQRKGGYACR